MEMVKRVDLKFECHGKGDNGVRSIVLLKGIDRFEVVRMIADEDMYKNGLERNFKKLVDMPTITISLTDLLNAYYKLGKLDETMWHNILDIYVPFIDRSKMYSAVHQFVEGEVW